MYGYTYIDCNEAALRLMGCSKKDQLVGLSPLDISPEYQPDGRLSSEKVQDIKAATISTGVNHFEWMQRTFSGKEFWVDVSQTVIPIQGRQIIYTAWRDISERKRAEEALRESEERYRIAIESSNDGVVDHAGRAARLYKPAFPRRCSDTERPKRSSASRSEISSILRTDRELSK